MTDTRFNDILTEMAALHDRKGQDYGAAQDRYWSCRGSEPFDVPAWVGVMIRMNDKFARVQSFCQKGSLTNESLEDSLIDLAVYAVISLVLYRETLPKEETNG